MLCYAAHVYHCMLRPLNNVVSYENFDVFS